MAAASKAWRVPPRMKPRRKPSPRRSSKPTGIASRRQPSSRSAIRLCCTKSASMASRKRRVVTINFRQVPRFQFLEEKNGGHAAALFPCLQTLRNRQADGLTLHVTARGRGDGNRIISRRGAADGRLLRRVAARWYEQKQREDHAQHAHCDSAPAPASPAQAEECQSGNGQPDRDRKSTG